MALPTAPDPQEHDRVSVHEHVVTQPSEAGLVVLGMDSFTNLELDEVGASMWQALAATGSATGCPMGELGRQAGGAAGGGSAQLRGL